MSDSRISGFYKLGVAERIARLEELGWLDAGVAGELRAGRQVISALAADKIIENVIGVFGLPMAIAPNFMVNDRECLVPLVVEEPSIVAALSAAASLARKTGGFSATLAESLLTGQVHVAGVNDADVAKAALQESLPELIELANGVHPRLVARGGGVRDIETRSLETPDGSELIVVHVLVDTCDAMGANLVNTICEAIAPRIQEICGGEIALRILSNLADRSVCSASVRFKTDDLATASMSGDEVRDRIVLANEIALVDSYRAATHNKGVMNGIDALAIATGNDWRAIEAGAHAYAARSGRYVALTHWSVDDSGDLLGKIELPLKPGTVGGTLSSNPAAALGLAISGVESASQLAELMAAVGLAQNFAALRALSSSGIQHGHMRLHARSLAAAAGTPDHLLDHVVEQLVAGGEIKDWKAKEILASLQIESHDDGVSTAAGKVILLGEHAVVYGRRALALPIAGAVTARASLSDDVTTLCIPDWNLSTTIDPGANDGLSAAVNLILRELGGDDSRFDIQASSSLPRGMGLGSSAAIAVAITRAISRCMGVDLDVEAINAIAFKCEKLAHGQPSGVDNTIASFEEPMVFRSAGELEMTVLNLDEAPPLVIGFSHQSGSTLEQVAGVRQRRESDPARFDALFDQMDEISEAGCRALQMGDYDQLGRLMNVCQGLLNAIGVSTPELETMIDIARQNGAVGTKLTGAGGGGSIVALCPGATDEVRSALHRAGYTTLQTANFGSSQRG